MKAFIVSLVLLVTLGTFIGFHAYTMLNMTDDISNKCNIVKNLASNDDWNGVISELDAIDEIWQKHRIWSALTINTNEIEQIEIALQQSKAYAKLEEKSDFFGEFIMFTMLLDHIPHQEGFHIEEIL